MYLVILQGMSVHLFFLSLKVGDIYSWYLPVSNVTRCKCSFFDEFTNKIFSFPASNAIPNGYKVTTENKNMFVRVTASRLKNIQSATFLQNYSHWSRDANWNNSQAKIREINPHKPVRYAFPPIHSTLSLSDLTSNFPYCLPYKSKDKIQLQKTRY